MCCRACAVGLKGEDLGSPAPHVHVTATLALCGTGGMAPSSFWLGQSRIPGVMVCRESSFPGTRVWVCCHRCCS